MERTKISTPIPHPTSDNLSTRAAELKAQLLQKRKDGRSNSITPSVSNSEPANIERDNAYLRSQNASPAQALHSGTEEQVNLNELISQYAKDKYAGQMNAEDRNGSSKESRDKDPRPGVQTSVNQGSAQTIRGFQKSNDMGCTHPNDHNYQPGPGHISGSETVRNPPVDSSNHTQGAPPSLEELLAFDPDLREWLDITGFHNITYRDKILSRRRALAELDAQREKLLAEMEAEERGLMPTISSTQTRLSIPPPPVLPRLVARPDASSASPVTPQVAPHTMVVTGKRSYAEMQPEANGDAEKTKSARIDHRDEQVERNELAQNSDNNSLSGGGPIEMSTVRHNSEGKYSFDSHHESSRDRILAQAPHREASPDQRAFEERVKPREKRPNEDDHANYINPRPFVTRGNYRGRNFDPLYRGRGRGKSIREVSPMLEQTFEPPVDLQTTYRKAITNEGSYKDPRGFDRGGRGG